MTREVAYQKAFETALESIEPNFPPGKLPGMPALADKLYEILELVDDREQRSAVDGGDGLASVMRSGDEVEAPAALKARGASRTAPTSTRSRWSMRMRA